MISPHRLVHIARTIVLVGLVLIVLAIPAATFAQDSGATVHTVGWGETLFTIAARYGVSQSAIISANNIANPDHLYAGQQLVIPGTGSTAVQPQSSGGRHVVQRGETLFRIATRYGLSVNALMAANGIGNPNTIYAGQVLTIPGSSGTTPPAAPDRPAATTGGTYIVQPGDTLFRIATRHGVTVAAMAQANSIANPSTIHVGQTLTIPAGGSSAPADDGDSSPPVTTPPSSSGGTHVVQRGETLFRIATNNGITVEALRAANGLTGNTIYVGQTLTIPGGSSTPAPPPTPVPADPPADPPPADPPPSDSTGGPGSTVRGKQIVVDLSDQTTYAYQDGVMLRSFVVSTGLPATPTVTGDYAVYLKYESQHMSGPGYSLPGVPWVMYFYRGYGFHGTYWHNNFGNPMSHGCVNMRTSEAAWLFQFAPIGTPVHVQY